VRVLAVGNQYPPHHFGGYELVWQSATLHLERHGHEVLVLTTDFATGAAEPDGGRVHRELRWYLRENQFPRLSVRERIALERHNHRVLRRHLKTFRPEVVAWWSMGGMSLSMLETVRQAGIPAVAFVHDDWLGYGPRVDGWLRPWSGRRRSLAPLLARITGVPTSVDFNHAARYVFVSEATRGRAIASGLAPGSSGVAHSGIDSRFLDPAPERDWSWSLLYVGRLDRRKGIDTAVAALALLPDPATLTIVGAWDRQEELRLKALAAQHGVAARTHFAGQRPRAGVHAAYGAADVVVFPVLWEEPWGLVPIEAMARGRPVVATGRGGSAEYLVDEENALLFEAGSPEALAGAVRRLATDRSLRRRLVERGLQTARRHTDEVFNDSVLTELVAAPGGNASGQGDAGQGASSPGGQSASSPGGDNRPRPVQRAIHSRM
jgi:glycosyltransferase involved in cell wall biosynthesis